MRVLHILQSNRFSGAENVVCQIIGMMKAEENIEMFYCSREGEIRNALNERNISFYPISSLTVSEVKRVIKEINPDIIHAHDMRASFIAALACGKITLISHIHNNAFDSRGFSPKSIAYLFAAKKAKHIFWVSQSSYDGYAFHSLFSNKSSVLYNTIDVDSLYKKMEQDTNTYDYDIVYVGRLTYPKNPERLIDVLKLVVEKKSDTKVAIIGTGDLEEKVKQLIYEKGLEENIYMLGFNSNPLKIMYDAKVMLMTSRWEGTPMCALEAMALGVPIVSTSTDGLCELITNGENGFLSNDDDELCKSVLRILNDKEFYNKLSECQHDRAVIINDISRYRGVVLNTYAEICG